jgi:hypothetical protein
MDDFEQDSPLLDCSFSQGSLMQKLYSRPTKPQRCGTLYTQIGVDYGNQQPEVSNFAAGRTICVVVVPVDTQRVRLKTL